MCCHRLLYIRHYKTAVNCFLLFSTQWQKPYDCIGLGKVSVLNYWVSLADADNNEFIHYLTLLSQWVKTTFERVALLSVLYVTACLWWFCIPLIFSAVLSGAVFWTQIKPSPGRNFTVKYILTLFWNSNNSYFKNMHSTRKTEAEAIN